LRLFICTMTAVILAVWPSFARADSERAKTVHASTGFFYAANPPAALFEHLDRLVLESDHFAQAPTSARAELFAYLSVGEVNKSRAFRSRVPERWVIGQNTAFDSEIVDTRNPEWRQFLLDQVAEPIWAKGFHGFFLDTLDSFARVSSAGSRVAFLTGIADFVRALRQRHPSAKILLNRGFDLLPALGLPVDGLVVESLFRSYDPDGSFRAVSESESHRLLEQIAIAQTNRALPVSVIDYLPARDQQGRRDDARKILQVGFDPWVAEPSLDDVGVGTVEIIPRRVLLLYQSAKDQTKSEGSLVVDDATVLVAPALEHLGYQVEYVDVRKPLPTANLAGQVAGIVTLLPDGVPDEKDYLAFLDRQLLHGIRVAFLEGFGVDLDSERLARLGLERAAQIVDGKLQVTKSSSYFGFEAPPRPHPHDLPFARAVNGSASESILRLADDAHTSWDAALLGPWGGVVFASYMLEEGLENERRFVLDPYSFLAAALALPPLLAADVTTESGRRVLTAHVDGDAFVSRVERPDARYAGDVLLHDILTRYALPHTVSVIEAEIGKTGLYPEESPRLEALAREIFKLPNVEIASHTFSHPFEWEAAEAGKTTFDGQATRLLVPGYQFDLDREIAGSVAYIDDRLAPAGKRTRVLLWPGSCTPSARAVEKVTALGLFNVNGGGSTRTRARPSITRGSALGIPKTGGVFQVFSPVENENVFTNDWTGPFYGYRAAIESFELTDSPRRTGPISIYFHPFSLTKDASLAALHDVYRWALAQETTPLWLSEYAQSVLAFERSTLAARVLGGDFEIGQIDGLHTLRVDPNLGYPDLARSVGIAGFRDLPQGRYLHLVPNAGRVKLSFSKNPPDTPYIASSNGRLQSVQFGRHSLRVKAAARIVPLELEIGGAKSCSLERGPAGTRISGTRLTFRAADPGEVVLDCH
jgi:hypothetical protein